jgi:hypothetical protein
MKRYTILARPTGMDYEVELAHVDDGPEAIAEGARQVPAGWIRGKGKRVMLPRYEHVRIRENQVQAGERE